MRKRVVDLLSALGVADANTNPLLDFVISSVQEKLKNLTNREEIPEGLENMAVRVSAGEYLFMMKNAGRLEGFNLDEAAMKSIKEGDTDITFAIGEGSTTPEQRLDDLIRFLSSIDLPEIYKYRRLVW